jgi:protoporphyrinogen oxidase
MASPSPPVVVLGAGLTGLSAAYHLRRPAVLVERGSEVGGHARSTRQDGFTFDVTGHWLHLRDPQTRGLVAGLFAPDELVSVERRTRVFTHGVLLPYPFQANLYGLPLAVVQECLVEFVAARERAARGEQPAPTFEAFAEARFGRGIARHFFVPYNTKLWGMHPNRLTAEWVSRYIPVPDVTQVIGGAIGVPQEGLGYNASFLYPRAGGIDALPRRLAQGLPAGTEVRLGSDVEAVDPANHRVKLTGEPDWRDYHALISTIPLPELVRRIVGAPALVREAAAALRWVRWRWLDVATRTSVPADYHWVYVPEARYPFFRVGVYSNAAASMAPAGCSSLYVELAERDAAIDVPEVLRALVEVGALASVDDVLFTAERRAEYAYVVFDDAYAAATSTILGWLERAGIRSCGRYGAWVYNAMEDCMIAGREAATWAMAQVRKDRS